MKISLVIAATATAILSAAPAHTAVQINSVYVRAGTPMDSAASLATS